MKAEQPHNNTQHGLRNSDRHGYVFLSYKREEFKQAERLRNSLRECGFNVWWDEDIQCGRVWNVVLDDAVKRAGCIVVLWSNLSMHSRWVMHEASIAMDRDVYAPVRIELCKIEPPYDRAQATDLLDWQGDVNHPGFIDLSYRLNELLPRRKTSAARIRDWSWANRIPIAAILFAALALTILGWQILASQSQLSQMAALLDQQKNAAGDLKTLREQQVEASQAQRSQTNALENAAGDLETLRDEQSEASREQLSQMATLLDQLETVREQAQATEEIAEGRFERTLQSLWTETNQIAVDDIAAQIRFIVLPGRPSTPPVQMFDDNWELTLNVRSQQSADAFNAVDLSPLNYYVASHLFRDSIGLTLVASSQTSRSIQDGTGQGQWTTYKFLRQHYTKGDLDYWRLGHHWNGAVIDAAWASFKVPDWLAYSESEYLKATKDRKFGKIPTAPLAARLTVYVRGVAIATAHGEAVKVGIPPRIAVRFPRMTISDNAFASPPFETSDDGHQSRLQGNTSQKPSNMSSKKAESK